MGLRPSAQIGGGLPVWSGGSFGAVTMVAMVGSGCHLPGSSAITWGFPARPSKKLATVRIPFPWRVWGQFGATASSHRPMQPFTLVPRVVRIPGTACLPSLGFPQIPTYGAPSPSDPQRPVDDARSSDFQGPTHGALCPTVV